MAYSNSINQITLLGRLINDVTEVRVGGEVKGAKFVLACDRPMSKGSDTSKTQSADFVPCIAWGFVAKHIIEYYHKGDRMLALGYWQSGYYVNKAGAKVYTHQCNVGQVFDMNKSLRGADNRPNAPVKSFDEEVADMVSSSDNFEIDESQLPF